jgi:hypothetical protein
MPRLSGSCATPVPIRSSRPMFQLLFFSFESASDIWGGFTSPYSDEHTPGGSTGNWWRVSTAARSTPCLWWLQTGHRDATDVAGSVRILVHHSGI